MGFFNFWKPSQNKKYRIPAGMTAEDHAQSLLNTVKHYCDEVNVSTTVIVFQYSYQKILEILDELIWLNEKKHISMSPPPRDNWIRIQNNLPATINDFLNRAVSQIHSRGSERADAIDELLRNINQNESFMLLLNHENKSRLEQLKNESAELRKMPSTLDIESKSVCSVSQKVFPTYGGIDAALLDIDLMDGHAFEHWCANALKNIGFCDVEVTPSSGDHGVDVLAKKDGVKYAIQCKRYNSDLGNKPIQEVHAGKALYHCHVGAVITNQHFTVGAKKLADATDTLLWDRDWIRNYLEQNSNALIKTMSNTVPVYNTITDYEDPMLNDAVDVVLETGQASVSMIQRRLKLGYARAARLMDTMEERGVVGPFIGSIPRDILITKEQWHRMNK